MSDHQTTPHDAWDELAAGYALHALEPEEELRFAEHLATCDECSALLRDHELVAAQLGALAYDEDDEVRAPAWSAIRASVVDVVDVPAPVSLDERRRPRRQPWVLGAAAAAVLLAGAGVAVWQTRGGSPTPETQAIRSCQHEAGCAAVRLHGSSGPDPAIPAK